MNTVNKTLSPEQSQDLVTVLKARFEKNRRRHEGFEWLKVESNLFADPGKLWSINQMEITGGEPDVVGQDGQLLWVLSF